MSVSRVIMFGGLGILLLAAVVIAVVVVIIAIVTSKKGDTDATQSIVTNEQPAVQCQPLPCEQDVSEENAEAVTHLSLGEIIKEHRIRCCMTQEYVAEALNVSRQAVSKWETDSSDPSTSNLLALAKLFGISAAELLERLG